MVQTEVMAQLPFQAFDADNHYYEAEDAFTRHIDPRMKSRCMEWATIRGRKRLLVGGKVNRFIPNPTFDPVARPGCLDEFFRGRNPEGKDIRTLFGELDPIDPAYRDRDARLRRMDEQHLEGGFFLPTLGVGIEESLYQDPPALLAAFRAFNRWLDDDWGFAYQERIFAAPYITLVDPEWAVEELEWALGRDVRVVVMRPGPVAQGSGFCSPGDARFDPFWARAAEAGITVSYHSGDAGYLRYGADWGDSTEFKAFSYDTLRQCLSASPIRDTLAALICHGVLERHPNLRIATIETGSSWVAPLVASLKKAYGQMPFAFQTDPVESFRRQVWVSPYYEDDLEGLRNLIGAEHVLFGSDYPHAEGLAVPTDYIHDLKGYDEDDVRRVMRENGFGLAKPRPA
jgi:predicted TIM-barrel fold metal-dependent hydrolase